MRKNILIVCLLFCLFGFYDPVFAKVGSETKTIVAKELMLSVWKETGSFILYGKTEKRKWVQLLSEQKIPSSYFFIAENGKSIGYGVKGEGSSDCQIVEKRIVYRWENEKIRVVTEFWFDRSQEENPYDILSIRLSLYHLSAEDREITLLSCFDLNRLKSEGHYYLPSKMIGYEYLWKPSDGFSEILLRSDYPKMNLKLEIDQQHSESGELPSFGKPDRVFVSNWRRIKDAPINYTVIDERVFDASPYAENDSALFLEYQHRKIGVAEGREVVYRMKLDRSDLSQFGKNVDDMELDELLQLLNELNRNLESAEEVDRETIDRINRRINELK